MPSVLNALHAMSVQEQRQKVLFPDADGVQNVIQTDMCRAHAVHTLKTE